MGHYEDVCLWQAAMDGEWVDQNGSPLRDFTRSAWEPPKAEPRLYDNGVSLTRQEFREECDVNTIMAHYEATAVMPPSMWRGPPAFLDVSDVPDLMGAMDVLKRGEAAFMTLPPQVRFTFENDPVRFVEFAQDPANLEQMREWKLAPPAPKPVADATAGVVSGSPPSGAGSSGGGVSGA